LPDWEADYDAAYRVVDHLDGKAVQNLTPGTTFTYDWAGRLQSVAYPLNSGAFDTVTYSNYDGIGNVGQRTDGNGVVIQYSYGDVDGLLSNVTYPSETSQNIALSYDAYDRPNSEADGTGSRSQTYDDLDNALTNTQSYTGPGSMEFQYGYYPDGSRYTLTDPSSETTYEYDGDGRCTQMPTAVGAFTDVFDGDARITRHTLPAGGYTTYTYYPTTLLTGESIYSGGSLLANYSSFDYDGAYDETGLKNVFWGSGTGTLLGTETRAFDNFSRLTNESSTQFGGLSQSFGFDASSNPTTFVGATQAFNNDNQIGTSPNFHFDGNGSPTTYNGTSCAYDLEARLTSYGSAWTAGYRSDGLRAWKDASGTKTYFYYDGDQPVLEANSSGTITAVNYYGANGLCARTAGTTSTFYQFDPQGNVAIRTSSSGELTDSSAFEPWGKEHAVATPSDPFGYNAQSGYYFDRETGLYYCDARYYDPSHGVWLTRDPAGFGGGSNLYGYCGANPVGRSDHAGMQVDEVLQEGLDAGEDFIEGVLSNGGPEGGDTGMGPGVDDCCASDGPSVAASLDQVFGTAAGGTGEPQFDLTPDIERCPEATDLAAAGGEQPPQFDLTPEIQDPTLSPTRLPRGATATIRKNWSKFYDWLWPTEPSGKPYIAHHIRYNCDNGTDDPMNIWPLTRAEHQAVHAEDYARWGGTRAP
jgi:RHS repeat-associated protein